VQGKLALPRPELTEIGWIKAKSCYPGRAKPNDHQLRNTIRSSATSYAGTVGAASAAAAETFGSSVHLQDKKKRLIVTSAVPTTLNLQPQLGGRE